MTKSNFKKSVMTSCQCHHQNCVTERRHPNYVTEKLYQNSVTNVFPFWALSIKICSYASADFLWVPKIDIATLNQNM